ncbi:MAG: bifunctional oligoribonuclease/PAP phosphatase NrnA [Bacteroidaceae bacterium]
MKRVISDEHLANVRRWIMESERIVVCAHVGPDGDAVGSSLAIRHWLGRWRKHADVIMPNRFPDFLHWLPGARDIRTYARCPDGVRNLIRQADLIVVADLNVSSRLREMESEVLANSCPKVMIDHHLNPQDFCNVTISHPEMCATSEVLCHLMDQMGELDSISYDEAVCLYTGMMCDTGAFTYASSRPDVYECVCRLLQRGIDKDRIYRNVFWSSSVARLKLQGYMLYVKLQVYNELHASVMTLTNEERSRFGIKQGDTEGFVNLPLTISGMKLSVFLSEDSEMAGIVKVSLRSVDDFPCDEMAARFFGGGGHKNASGGRLECTMEDAVKRVEGAIRAYAEFLK